MSSLESHAIRPAAAVSRSPPALGRLRVAPALAWLGSPVSYIVGALIVTALSAGTTLLAPRFLDPVAFGDFALLTSLFALASRADFGLSQLADREMTGRPDAGGPIAFNILRAQWIVGGAVLAVLLPLALAAPLLGGTLPVLGTTLALIGGIMGMIANGPVTLFRAASRVWEFTALALVLHAGLTAPRLAGLIAGGATGCFAALAVYYAACAFLFARPARRGGEAFRLPILPMLRTAVPLFVFNISWIAYLSANRWICSFLTSARDLGLFSFGASLAAIGLGLLSTMAQVRYPKLLTRMTGVDPRRDSAILEREMLGLALLLACVALCAILFARGIIHLAFPGYEEAVPVTVALAAACVPLGAMAWIVPMVIVRSPAPGADAFKLFGIGMLWLAAGMTAGERLAGIEGQAWGSAAAALVTLASMARLMRRRAMITDGAAWRTAGAQGAIMISLAALATWQASDQAAAQTASLPPLGAVIFQEDFDQLDLSQGEHGIWEPHYPSGARTNRANGEMEYYVDPRPGGDAPAVQALWPYAIRDGVLAIRASRVPEGLRQDAGGFPYASGLLTTAESFSFTYGSAEIRARMPKGQGLWPAFWLLPADLSWPPEIDVFEVLGHETDTLHVTVHSGLGIPAGTSSAQSGRTVAAADLSEDFHIFGVVWTPETITWTLDGKPVAEVPTPHDMHKPMFLLVNLAVGGHWPGAPNASTDFPASLLVDWIRVRRLADGGEAPQ